MNKLIPSLALAAVLALPVAMPTTAYAEGGTNKVEAKKLTFTVNWEFKNDKKSYTGAIFHSIKNGDFAGVSVLEPNSKYDELRVKVNFHTTGVGLTIYQPANACVKVWRRMIVWQRIHYYQPRSVGTDRWVSKGVVDDGRIFKVRIIRAHKDSQGHWVC